MLPHELPTTCPKSILKTVWSINVLKVGLGLQNEVEVRAWFANNPDVLVEFEKLNGELMLGIHELQQRAIAGLRHVSASTKGFDNNSKRKKLD